MLWRLRKRKRGPGRSKKQQRVRQELLATLEIECGQPSRCYPALGVPSPIQFLYNLLNRFRRTNSERIFTLLTLSVALKVSLLPSPPLQIKVPTIVQI
jgi:hypothetical protein